MAFFEDILKTAVTDEADRNQITALSAKYPALIKAVDDTDSAASAWERWKAANWDQTSNKTKDQVAAEQRVAALEAAGSFGAEMTFDEIKANLAREGYVVKSDLANAIKDPTGQDPVFQAVRGVVNSSANGIEYFFRRAGSLPVEHLQEFGKVDPTLMDRLIDAYAKAPAGSDPRKVYDELVAPERAAIQTAKQTELEEKHKQELAAAEARGAEKAKQELGMAAGTSGMPTDQGGGQSSSMGPLQRQQAERFSKPAEGSQPPSAAPLGSGIVAREGLAWLAEQRVSGGVQ